MLSVLPFQIRVIWNDIFYHSPAKYADSVNYSYILLKDLNRHFRKEVTRVSSKLINMCTLWITGKLFATHDLAFRQRHSRYSEEQDGRSCRKPRWKAGCGLASAPWPLSWTTEALVWFSCLHCLFFLCGPWMRLTPWCQEESSFSLPSEDIACAPAAALSCIHWQREVNVVSWACRLKHSTL